ncbi:hypothetical protein [Hymenobacter sp.]|jgi:hypothetical protein|uniref:hypothetical protein n=1 Tax=Hymenobacter sp. TaxID=1898978 RepID=UPI002EDB8BC9
MFRSCLVLLLLVHYLLVVGAGLVGRPEPVRQRAADYVHSADCQRQHYLQLDCFDHCNGEQYVTHKPGQQQSWPQLLSSLKGLDVHCHLPTSIIVLELNLPRTQEYAAELGALFPVGFAGKLYAPPRRG